MAGDKGSFGQYPEDPQEIANLVERNARAHAERVARGTWWSRHGALLAAGVATALVASATASEYLVAGTIERARHHTDMQKALGYQSCMTLGIGSPQTLPGGRTVELSRLTIQDLRDCGLDSIANGIEDVWNASAIGERPAISGPVQLPPTAELAEDMRNAENPATSRSYYWESGSLLGGAAMGGLAIFGLGRLTRRRWPALT